MSKHTLFLKAFYNNWTPLGTPLAWTSDNEDSPFYSPLNPDLGDHAWLLDMDMDCSQTQDGWFAFKTSYANNVGKSTVP